MSRNHFGTAILHFLGKHRLTQTDLSKSADLRQSSISDLISHDKRPEIATLQKLCRCWPTPETNILLLIAHLKDEIARAGHNPESDIEMRPNRPHSLAREKTMENMAYLEAHIEDRGVVDGVALIVYLIRRSEHAAMSCAGGKVAESKPALDIPSKPEQTTPRKKGGHTYG